MARRGGRAPGSKNKITQEARALAQSLVGSAKYQKWVKAQLDAGELAPELQKMLWHYAYGVPKQTHEMSGPDGGPITLANYDLMRLSTSELETLKACLAKAQS